MGKTCFLKVTSGRCTICLCTLWGMWDPEALPPAGQWVQLLFQFICILNDFCHLNVPAIYTDRSLTICINGAAFWHLHITSFVDTDPWPSLCPCYKGRLVLVQLQWQLCSGPSLLIPSSLGTSQPPAGELRATSYTPSSRAASHRCPASGSSCKHQPVHKSLLNQNQLLI